MCGWAWSWAQSSAKTQFCRTLSDPPALLPQRPPIRKPVSEKFLQSRRTFYLALFPQLSPPIPYLSQFESLISLSAVAWHMPELPARHIRYSL
jgi:hypothetical protein